MSSCNVAQIPPMMVMYDPIAHRFIMLKIDNESLVRQIDAQSKKLSSTIGTGLRSETIKDAKSALANANTHPDYVKYDDVQFIYVIMEDSTTDMAKRIVDEWVAEPSNIKRAENAVGRSRADDAEIVKAFCAIRFKNLKRKWEVFGGGLSSKCRERSTVVIIALEDLNPENGCFVSLKPGEDLCVDGSSPVFVPGNGEGLAIFLDLNL